MCVQYFHFGIRFFIVLQFTIVRSIYLLVMEETQSDNDLYARSVCIQCGKQYQCQMSLTRHIQSVHYGVRYACKQCDHKATSQSNLTRHLQSIHEGVKYACNQCEYQATQKSNLTQHIQSVHEGVKYACNQCDHQFTGRGNLNLFGISVPIIP